MSAVSFPLILFGVGGKSGSTVNKKQEASLFCHCHASMPLKSESHTEGINLETGKQSEDTHCFHSVEFSHR